ncbi:MAG TPA: hypothetical protein VKA46_24790, partial [Gemmataceae bacterium]|nr:hypothetical protein [Gemmataceae bacterium]
NDRELWDERKLLSYKLLCRRWPKCHAYPRFRLGKVCVDPGGWALPILAGLLLAPSAARASCGDYVTTRLSAPHHAAPGEQPPPAVPKPHKPCHGAHCSQAPASPPAPVPTTSTQTLQEWGCVLDELALTPLGSTPLLARQQAPRLVRLPSGIFHPPRIPS